MSEKFEQAVFRSGLVLSELEAAIKGKEALFDARFEEHDKASAPSWSLGRADLCCGRRAFLWHGQITRA